MTTRVTVWLAAVRDAFVAILPLTLFRVTIELLSNVPWKANETTFQYRFGTDWFSSLNYIYTAINNIFSLSLAVFVAIHLAKRLIANKKIEGLSLAMVGLASISNFVLWVYICPTTIQNHGQNLIILAVIIGISSAELFCWLSQTFLGRLEIPYDTEETLFHSMRSTAPLIVMGFITFIAIYLYLNLPPLNTNTIENFIIFASVNGNGVWWLSSLATLLNQGLWFVGFHGGIMLDLYFNNLFLPAGMPYSPDKAWRPMFDGFVLMGGAGATLGLLLAIAITTKNDSQRKIAQLSVLPSIFNINDILLYGLPIVLNPIYLIPFIVVPLILMLITVASVQFGFIAFHVNHIAWTTPPFVSGWMLTGSWRGVFLQAVYLGISTLIYLPFVRRAESANEAQAKLAFKNAVDFLLHESQSRVTGIQKQGQIGIVSRGLLKDLQNAIEKNLLSLAYQPKHYGDGTIVGVEALLRWNHPIHGSISPLVAITLAEDSGDIYALGLWVLDEAIACKSRWNALGYQSLTMAINVSPEQLSNPLFPKHIEICLQKYGVAAHEIELEITESTVIPDTPQVDQTLKQLVSMDVRLAMDDFGMGYSSLLYMRTVKVHTLKIDGSVTRDVLNNSTNADIIRTIAGLGNKQKLDVVAEYVETENQQRLLAELGCNVFQGYLHSPPLNENACLAYFQKNV